MNPNHDKQLDLAISRALKALPELTVPASVATRVMATIERRSQVSWYRRSWETWPVALRFTSLAVMLALFGGLCFAGWELSRSEAVLQAMQRARQWSSGLSSIGNLVSVLTSSAVLVVKKLGTTFIIACLFSAGLGYALFLALGTVYFRLAFSKRKTAPL